MRSFVAPRVLVLAALVVAGCETEKANRPPVARAGEDVREFREVPVLLSGSESFDPDGDALAYSWRLLSGPESVQGSTQVALEFTPTVPGTYVFELAVEDDAGSDSEVATDVVSVQVDDFLSVTVVPQHDATDIAGRQPVVAIFDRSIRPWTAAGALTVVDVTDSLAPLPVPGNVVADEDGTSIVFFPVADWADTALYEVTVATSALSHEGWSLPAPAVSRFTGAAVDVAPPQVLAVTPADGSTGVPHGTVVEVLFSEPVEADVPGVLTLDDGVSPVAGVVARSAGGTRATFVPMNGTLTAPIALAGATGYTFGISGTLEDAAGNTLGQDEVRLFTTAPGADTTAPEVVSISPLRGASGVSVKLPVVVTFSEPVDPSTVPGAIVVGTSGGAAFGAAGLPGTYSMARGNTVALFTPSANLATGTTYEVQVAGTVADLSGNLVPAAFDSFFSTGSAPPPSVLTVVADRGPIGATLLVDVIGEDFVSGATAFVPGGGVLVSSSTVLSDTQMQAELTISPSAALGPRSLTVTNPDGQSGTGLNVFEILQRPPAVSSLTPSGANLGELDVAVSVIGAEFQAGATVDIQGGGVTIDSVGFVNGGQLDIQLDVDPAAAIGFRDVTVTNPDGQSITADDAFRVRLAAPDITGISEPSGGQGESLFSVVLTGTNIIPSPFPSIDMGAGVLAAVVAADATSVTLNVTVSGTASLGPRDVTLTNADGQNATELGLFTVVAAPPTVVGSSPAVPQGETLPVTFNGTNFQCTGSGPQVEIRRAGAPSAGVSVDNSAGGLTACSATSFERAVTVTGAAVVGPHGVRVTNPDLQFREGANTFEVLEERPVVTDLQTSGGADLSVVSRKSSHVNARLIGNFFRSGATVSMGPDITLTSLTFVSATELQLSFSVSDVAALAFVDVIVTNPDTLQGTGDDLFSVREAAPSVTSLSAPQINQGQTLAGATLGGADFQCGPDPTVTFSGLGVSATVTGCTASTLTIDVSATPGAALGGRTVTVTNADGQAGTSAAALLSVREQAPDITGLTVASGRQEQVVSTRINGSFFRSGAQVSFGAGIAVTIDAIDAGGTFIDVTLTIADLAAAGARTVTVVHPDDGQNDAFSPFTVQLALPNVSSASPSPVNQGDALTLTVNGDDFDCTGNGPTVELLFGGVASAGITVDNAGVAGACTASSFTRPVAIGAGTTVGTHTLRVTNPDGGQGTGGSLQVREQTPDITSLSVASGRQEQVVSTRINGSFFRAGAQVSFGAGIAVTVDAIDAGGAFIDVTLTIADAAATGPRTVTVTHPDDGQGDTFSPFTVELALPDVVSVAPSPRNQGQSFTLAVTGSDFDCTGDGPTVEVLFAGAPSADVTVDNTGAAGACLGTSFTRPVSIGAAAVVGSHTIRVTNPDGGQGTGGTLEIREQQPAITGLTVSSGRQEQVVSTRIDGSFFRPGAQVSFGLGIAVTVDAIDPGESFIDVTLTIADGATVGARTVTVTHPDDGQNATFSPFDVELALPDVTSAAPSPVNRGQAFTMTVNGGDFDCTGNGPTVEVLFGGSASAGITVDNSGAAGACGATSFTRPVSVDDTAVVGLHTIRVTNPDGGQGTGGTLEVRERAPSITGLTVASGRQEQVVPTRIEGEFFRTGAVVSFGAGIAVTVDGIDPDGDWIDVTLTIAGAAALGPRTVTVTHPDDGQNDTFSPFTVERALPDVTSVSPTPVNRGDSITLAVTGDDFDCSGNGPTVEVLFGGVASADVTVDNSGAAGACTATGFTRPVDVGGAAVVGLHSIRVTNPDGGQGTGGSLQIRHEQPVVTGLTVATGRQEQVVSTTIEGSFFRSGAQVSFGAGIAVTIDSIADDAIDVTLTINDAAAPGARTVTVTHPDDGQNDAFSPFTVELALPKVSGAAPGPQNRGAVFTMTVTGSDFDCSGIGPTVEVLFGGMPDAAITVNNAVAAGACTTGSFTRDVTVGAAAEIGSHTLRVTNPDGGSGTGGDLAIRHQAPEITGLTVTTGRQEQVVSTRINGSFFRAGAQVSFGAGIAVTIDAIAPGAIDVTLTINDAAATGARTVSVSHPDDGQGDTFDSFTVALALPEVSALAPSPVNRQTAFTITVSGDDFDCSGLGPTVAFLFGGSPSTELAADNGVAAGACTTASFTRSVTVGDDTELGAHVARVTNPDGGQGTGGSISVIAEAPQISDLKESDGTTDLPLISRKQTYVGAILQGDYFQVGAQVSMSGGVNITSQNRIDQNTIQLTIEVPAGATIGASTIFVVNPDGQQSSNATIVAVRRAAPSIASVNPSEGNRGSTYNGVEIAGADFDCTMPGPTVYFGPDTFAMVTACQADLLTVDLDLDLNAAMDLGPRDVIVTNPDLQEDTGTGFFEVLAEEPVVTSVVASSGRRTDTLTVTVSGQFFEATPAVGFGSGISVTGVLFTGATSLSVDITIAPSAPLGFRTVTVTNPDTQVGSLGNAFEVLRAVPVVVSITPSSASRGEPNFVATIQGDHFDCRSVMPVVTVGDVGVVPASVTCGGATDRETQLDVTLDVTAPASGNKTVSVTNDGDGSAGLGAGLFRVDDEAPELMGLSTPLKQGQTLADVRVQGNFFKTGAVVSFPNGGASVVGDATFLSATELSVTIAVPFGTAVGSYDVLVTNTDDGQFVQATVLDVIAADPPSISSVCTGTTCDPAWADQSGTQRVVITGAAFQSVHAVSIGGGSIPFAPVSANATTIVVDVSPGLAAEGLYDVEVTNLESSPNQSATATGALRVTKPAPVVSTITPDEANQGDVLDGTDGVVGGIDGEVTITGSSFEPGATVTFSGSGVTGTVVSIAAGSITLDIVVDATATIGFRDVIVTNPDSGRGVLTGGFEVKSTPGAPQITSVVRHPSSSLPRQRTDDGISIRQGETATFRVSGANFDPGPTVFVSGAGVTVNSVTWLDATRLDVSVTISCADIAPGYRDVTVVNPPPPAGNGRTGTAVDQLVVRHGVVINEVATDGRTDHSAVNPSFTDNDEVVELFNGSGCMWNLTDWRLDIVDTGDFSYEIGSTTREVYTAGSDVDTFLPGAYLLIDDPDNGASNMQDDVFLGLFTQSGRFIDHVEIGTGDQENDGAADGAPGADGNGDDGNAVDDDDEMVARCPNGSVTDDLNGTDNDVADFYQSELAASGFDQAATNLATNDTECPPCADGGDTDGDGWVDMLDPGCTDPHTDPSEGAGAEGTTQCNDDLDNDGDLDGIDELDPDCFSGFDNDESQ